jgi:spore coat polysaccharide biosynthesis protein SpsF
VTNIQKRTFPKGQSVEILRADTFKRVVDFLRDPYDQEHATAFYYKNPENFKIFNIESGLDLGHIQLSIDTETDFLSIEELLTKVDPATVTWQTLVSELKMLKCLESRNGKSRATDVCSGSQC